jgi:hypothetical protein
LIARGRITCSQHSTPHHPFIIILIPLPGTNPVPGPGLPRCARHPEQDGPGRRQATTATMMSAVGTSPAAIRVHYRPTSASWMNLVEVWFGIIERQAIHRGSLSSVRDLTGKIRAFIDAWNTPAATHSPGPQPQTNPGKGRPPRDLRRGALGCGDSSVA